MSGSVNREVDELPWSIKRNRFIALPRGPTEWGRLLYEPDWSRRFFLVDFRAIFAPPLTLSLLWLVVSDTLEGNVIPGREMYALIFIAMVVGAVLLSTYMVVLVLKRMPFRVYEEGFTLEKIPLELRLLRRGVLVPADRITSVSLRRRMGVKDDAHSVVVRYTDEDGTSQSLEVRPEDPLSALAALAQIAPGRMGDDVTALLDPGRGDEALEEEESASDRMAMLLFPLALWLFVGVFIAMPLLLVREGIETGHINLLPVVLGLCMVLFLSAAGWYIVPIAFATLFTGPDVVAGTEGLEVRLPLLVRLHMRSSEVLPYDWIRRARRCLSPGSFKTRYQMLAGTGRPISISARVFRELSCRPGFQREGFELVNAVEPPQGFQRLARPNLPGVVAIVVAVTVVSLLVLASTGYPEDGEDPAEDAEGPPPELTLSDKLLFFGSLSFLVGFVSIMGLLLFRKNRLEKRAEGIELDGGSIRLPHVGAPFGEVGRSEVVSITGRRLLMFDGHVLVMETTKGRLFLPIYLVDDLREHGYVVVLPEKLERTGRWKD